MPGVQAWGYYPTTGVWLPIQVNANGKIIADMSAVNLDDLADVSVASPSDQDFFYYDDATGLWKSRALLDADIPATIARDSEVTAAIATHAALASVHHAKYTDAEALAYIEAELRQISEGATLLWDMTDAGILSLPKQPAALIYPSTTYQYIPSGAWTHVRLDSVDHDIQSETDVTVVDGTADSTVANKLHDTGAFTEAEEYYDGRTVCNTTDNTFAKVTGKDSNDQLSIDTNIMANGEDYKLYFSRYTATEAGRYLIIGSIAYEEDDTLDGKKYIASVWKNGNEAGKNRILLPADNQFAQAQVVVSLSLAADDYVDLRTYHDTGVTAKFSYSTATILQVYLAVIKVA